MPTWVLWIAAAATVLTSLGVIWNKFLHPLLTAVNMAIDTFPVLLEFATEFKDAPGSMSVLNEIASQFRTDGGSSLRDVVNDLGTAVERVEAVQAQVATDLDAARSRADVVGPGHQPGTASDAAARHDPNDMGGGDDE